MIIRDQRHLIVRREKLEGFLELKHPGVSQVRAAVDAAIV
jgi:hypothetical protein